MPTKNSLSLSTLVDAVKSFKGKTAKSYRKQALAAFQKMNLNFIGSGATCDVFSSEKCSYVVKLSDEEGLKFKPANQYGNGYLRPLFVSENGLIAIQQKAETRKSIDAALQTAADALHNAKVELAHHQNAINEALNRIKTLSTLEVELGAKIGELKAKKSLLVETNVENGSSIPDIHVENIGIHKNRILCIDLNSQFKKTHYEEGESHD